MCLKSPQKCNQLWWCFLYTVTTVATYNGGLSVVVLTILTGIVSLETICELFGLGLQRMMVSYNVFCLKWYMLPPVVYNSYQ